MKIEQFILLAFLVETIVQTLKLGYDWDNHKPNIDIIVAMVVGIGVFLAADIDLFKLAEIPLRVPFVGAGLSGLMAARGAAVSHDIIKFITSLVPATQ